MDVSSYRIGIRHACRTAGSGVLALALLGVPAAWALSEIKTEEGVSEIRREHLPAPENAGPQLDQQGTSATTNGGQTTPDDQPAEDGAAQNGPPPEVQYDLSTLPQAVRSTHDRLIEAARAGDLEMLRPLIATGQDGTQLSFGDDTGDPIEFLRSISGDGEGHEILAILEEVLGAGFVHLDAGKPEELYVWPYFFAMPLESLTPRQRVELFKIVTAGDYEEMKTYGAYVFYRVGITPAGAWAFFVAGD